MRQSETQEAEKQERIQAAAQRVVSGELSCTRAADLVGIWTWQVWDVVDRMIHDYDGADSEAFPGEESQEADKSRRDG